MLLAVMFVVDLVMVKDRPSQAGFADMDTGDATSKDADRDKPIDFAYLVRRVFSNPVILTIIAAEFCTGFVRQGVLLWFGPYLKEVHQVDYGSLLYSIATIGITVGGILGGLLCGYLSDRVFGSRRPRWRSSSTSGRSWRCCCWVRPPPAPGVPADTIRLYVDFWRSWHVIGHLGHGFRGNQAAATVTGICDGVQYLASGLTGFLLGGVWTNSDGDYGPG